jgi:hypothetical protein
MSNKNFDYEKFSRIMRKMKLSKNVIDFIKVVIESYNEKGDILIEKLNSFFDESKLNNAILEKILEIKYLESECQVCTESFDCNFKPLDPCGHYIHIDCVRKSPKSDECPVCRTKINLSGSRNCNKIEKKEDTNNKSVNTNSPNYDKSVIAGLNNVRQLNRYPVKISLGSDSPTFHIANIIDEGNYKLIVYRDDENSELVLSSLILDNL